MKSLSEIAEIIKVKYLALQVNIGLCSIAVIVRGNGDISDKEYITFIDHVKKVMSGFEWVWTVGSKKIRNDDEDGRYMFAPIDNKSRIEFLDEIINQEDAEKND